MEHLINCIICGNEEKLNIPNICFECCMKKYSMHLKVSRWYALKKITYVFLLYVPFALFLGLKFNFKVELLFITAFALGHHFNSIIKWCMKIF